MTNLKLLKTSLFISLYTLFVCGCSNENSSDSTNYKMIESYNCIYEVGSTNSTSDINKFFNVNITYNDANGSEVTVKNKPLPWFIEVKDMKPGVTPKIAYSYVKKDDIVIPTESKLYNFIKSHSIKVFNNISEEPEDQTNSYNVMKSNLTPEQLLKFIDVYKNKSNNLSLNALKEYYKIEVLNF